MNWPHGLTPDMRALLLMLKADGGWWTVAQLTPCWCPTFKPHGVQQALDALEAGGFIESRDRAGSRIYGVSPACETLPDLAPRADYASVDDRSDALVSCRTTAF